MDRYTLVRVVDANGRVTWYVRQTLTRFNSPEICTQDWPIRDAWGDACNWPGEMDGMVLTFPSRSSDAFVPDFNALLADARMYRLYKDRQFVLANGGKTESDPATRTVNPLPPPKTKKPVRYENGRWHVVLKSGLKPVALPWEKE
jgi:hypothetical protein